MEIRLTASLLSVIYKNLHKLSYYGGFILATHKSAEKRNRQNLKRNARNTSIKSKAKTSARRVLEAVSTKDKGASDSALKKAISTIDKAASKGTLHRNTAARKISRLTRKVNALA